jgi:hypothetical protein
MIQYRKQIQLKYNARRESWQIVSDCGSHYDTTIYTSVKDWWDTQAQTELRGWQKDICIRETADVFGRLQLFNSYKKGRGWTQLHDLCLVHNEQYQLWVFSTQDNFWICNSSDKDIVFDVKDSLGSIMNPNDRKTIYDIYDQMKKHYNPEHLCRWIDA